MAVDIFLKLDGIKGESQDSKHKEEIDVMSYSFGASQAGTMSYGGGGGAGKVQFQDLSFTHRVDKSSPVLFLHCANGAHIKEATLTNRKAGKEQLESLVIKLYDVLVSSCQQSDSAGGDLPVDNVTLNFAKIEMEYKEQKKDGTLGAGVKFNWDQKLNKGA
jgi:type VI secretion system secreted protein Hcp